MAATPAQGAPAHRAADEVHDSLHGAGDDTRDRSPGPAPIVAPLALLALSVAAAITLVTVAPDRFDPRALPWFLGLTLVAVAVRVRGAREPSGSPRARLAFWLTTAVTLCLVLLNPAFGLYAFIGYPDGAHHLRGREGAGGLLAVAVICSIAQTGGVGSPLFAPPFLALFIVVNLVVAGSMAAFDRQRRRATEAVAQANSRLREAQVRNESLQAELLSQAREAGVTAERGRLAREIHDTLAQDLVAIIAQVSAAQAADAEVGEGADPEASAERRRRLARAEQTARAALAEARRSVQALSSPRLDTDTLPAALDRLLDAWQEVSGATARLAVTGQVRGGDADEVALRIVQEALANVLRHAGARSVEVRLRYDTDALMLEIADDGAGFDPSAPHGGRGIAGMRERARQAGGEVDVVSASGEGTRVTARLPGRWS